MVVRKEPLFVIVQILFILTINSKSEARQKDLKLQFPDQKSSWMTLNHEIQGVYQFDQTQVLLPTNKTFVIFNQLEERLPKKTNFKEPFKYSKRHFVKGIKNSFFVGYFKHPHGHLLFDGKTFTMFFVSYDFEIISKHSIRYDKIKPPRDKGGEAPWQDISQFRKRFIKAYQASKPLKAAGLTSFSQTWSKSHSSFLISTQIPNFPVLKMQCQIDNPSNCRISRACYTSNISNKTIKGLSGIAYRSDQKKGGPPILLLGSQHNNKVLKFHYHSCQNISYKLSMQLPSKIKKIGGISIDSNNNLWVSSLIKDDYYNASLYTWPAKMWIRN